MICIYMIHVCLCVLYFSLLHIILYCSADYCNWSYKLCDYHFLIAQQEFPDIVLF